MDTNDNKIDRVNGPGNPRIWSGIILLLCGVLLLAYKMGAPIPDWLFTWPVLLILVGFISGIKNQFRNPGGLILIAIGGIFLIDQNIPSFHFHDYLVPVILIAVGIIYISRPRHSWNDYDRGWKKKFYSPPAYQPSNTSFTDVNQTASQDKSNEEWVEINAVFGSVKKVFVSKNFKGGEVNTFMGGAELNFTQADLQQQVSLEVNAVFGGVKIIVPSNWSIKNNVTAIFGGIEDKRTFPASITDSGKTLLLHGSCVFGGIEIINY